jgi:hypothetical protein
LPGLIDTHVHTFADRRRDAARFGVTSMVDMFCDTGPLDGFRRDRDDKARTRLADVWSAGTLVTVPGGHGSRWPRAPTCSRTCRRTRRCPTSSSPP